MQVSKEGIETVKRANELAAIVAERGIELRRKGQVLVGRCPFHQEKTPSFTITPRRGLFHCFGCGAAGDVIGFITKYDQISFKEAVEKLCQRVGLSLVGLMERPAPEEADPLREDLSEARPALLERVVEHYHKTFCQRADAQEYLEKRGLIDPELLRVFKVGYANGSLLEAIPKQGELRAQLMALGVITRASRELLGGCIVVPIPDPISGQWVSLYGRGIHAPRHCYLPGPFRGVINYQAARTSSEVILTESILDAFSFHQAGIRTAIPLYGTNGFTSDHLDTLKREGVHSVILALDNDEPGRKAAEAVKEKLAAAGIAVRSASYPPRIKDANELLISRNGDATDAFKAILGAPDLKTANRDSKPQPASPLTAKPAGNEPLTLARDGLTYTAKIHSGLLGRLRATVKVVRGDALHVDTIDLYASRSRSEFARRVEKVFGVEAEAVESALLALLIQAERAAEEQAAEPAPVITMSEAERAAAIAFLQRPDLLDRVAADIDALGYVGEDTNKRLLYLVAVSRKLEDPLSAIVMSQSAAGKSGLTEVIEKLSPPEDVVLLTRLTPQSLYYTEPGFLDRKLVIVEERYGSMEADYSIRVLQSRKKLIAAAPIKDPQTGNMRTKVFMVEARAAFIEATTAGSVNHENATRCFELLMDESEEQTRRIHQRQRAARTERGLVQQREAEAIVRRHWNAQRLLEPAPVVIPFAERLSFPTAWMRTRRDHARFLNLIEVSAFLHQHQRERRSGAIVAALGDYTVAYGLAAQVLAETFADVRRPLREAYERIREISRQRAAEAFSRRELREALEVPDSTLRRWLSELVELEYLEAEGSTQGKPVRYRLSERGPKAEVVLGLLSPAELRV
jgi:DNA primase catalytic core